MSAKGESTRERILEAAEKLILEKGYAGTTLDDVLKATELTKGAFFHHFKGKAELARAVAERYGQNDIALFKDFASRAERLTDDPLERVLIFLKLFEDFLDDLKAPFPGCIFASYTHESGQFGPEIRDFVQRGLDLWVDLYEARFAELIAVRPPARPVTARTLAEMIASIIEGSFVMANAENDPTWAQRQSAAFRGYLEMLFRSA